MIIDSIILFAYKVIAWVIALFPAGNGFPETWHNGIQTLGGYLGMIDTLVPLDVLYVCAGVLIATELGIFAFKNFKWIISHIPFVGGKGV